MAYFDPKNAAQDGYTHQFAPARNQSRENDWEEDGSEEEYDGYDDGFDDLIEEDEEEEIPEEELRREKQRRFRIAAGFGDLGATLVGVAVILVLVAFLISMIQFVTSDFAQNFSIWQTKF